MSLRDLVKERITKNIIQDAQSKMKKKYTVIIADDKTIKILNNCFQMHELNELDIAPVILNIKSPREKLKVSPIYFLSTNYESTKHMCADYANSKETIYKKEVHIYFSSKVPKTIIKLIKNENIRKYIQTFCETHCDFVVLEHRLFSLNGGYKSFNNLYINKENHMNELTLRAQQLVSLFFTLNSEPNIRYSTNSNNAKTFAKLFKTQFNDIKSILKNNTMDNNDNCTLFIFDRKDDLITPLLHNLSFQPMIYDLLHENIIINNGKTQIEEKDTYRDMPDENDRIWIKYRHEFIGDIVQKLPKQFNEWQTQNAVIKMKNRNDSNTNINTKDLRAVIHAIPQYHKLVKQYTTNINLASKLQNIFKINGLRDIISLEQNMVTGMDENGKKINKIKMQQEFLSILMDMNKAEIVKLRLFMLYVTSQGNMKYKQREILLKQCGFNSNIEHIIDTLGYLGNNKLIINSNYWKDMIKIAQLKSKTNAITRFTSYLQWVLQQYYNSLLNEKDFECIKNPQNKKKIKTVISYRKRPNKLNDNISNEIYSNTRPTYVVFFLGGISYSEIKICYEFAKNNDINVFVGSTLIYSPQQYLKCFDKTTKDNQ